MFAVFRWIPGWISTVVVEDLLLLDGNRRNVTERAAAVVGRLQIQEERRHGVAVMDDG